MINLIILIHLINDNGQVYVSVSFSFSAGIPDPLSCLRPLHLLHFIFIELCLLTVYAWHISVLLGSKVEGIRAVYCVFSDDLDRFSVFLLVFHRTFHFHHLYNDGATQAKYYETILLLLASMVILLDLLEILCLYDWGFRLFIKSFAPSPSFHLAIRKPFSSCQR